MVPGRRLALLALFLAVWGTVVVGRLAQIQIAQATRYRSRAQRQQERRIEVSPRRGSILDRQGRELAVSVEVSSVFAIPEEVEDAPAVAGTLAPLLRTSPTALLSRLTQKKGFVWLGRKIDSAVAEEIRARRVAGVHLLPDTKRFYPKGSLAASVLGYVGTDDRGLGGLEYFYDATVRGRPGEIVALTDARRLTYGEAETRSGRAPEEGATLAISIDSGIQFAAERELAAAVEEFHAKSGSVVVLDPVSGEIFGMASVPGFDPNQYGRFSSDAWRNRAIADAYEPGSTFKIVTGATALEQHLVTLNEVIETGNGTIRIGSVEISEHDRNRYGALTLAGVFEHSSNVGIIRVGLRLGPDRLFAGATAFGIGQPTGVDLPGESAGIFRPLSRWSALSNAEISMGQEVALTSLQLARVAAVVANGGMLVRPHLVTRVLHPDGRSESPAAPTPVRVMSESTARSLRDILVGVVERGTGTRAAIPGFAVAGKTGTAQKAGVGGYQAGRYIPNFVGFAPAQAPRVVTVIVIEEPKGRYYAGEVAAPVFARIVSQALGILRVAPEEQRLPATVLTSLPRSIAFPEGMVPASVRESRFVSRPPQLSGLASDPVAKEGRIPDATRLSARRALALFARLGLPTRLHGTGFVVAQDPPAGTILRPGETQTIFLSEADPPSRSNRAREEAGFALPAP